MTEEANNQRITEAYRDLATETTPAGLDEKVLRIATHEARSRYGIARAWVRPVAWAATIGLSLAIMLEVLQVIPRDVEPEPAALSEEIVGREDAAESPAAASTMIDPAAVAPGGGTEELGARRTAPQDRPRQKEVQPVVLDDTNAFAARDIRILEEAEAQARQRAGEPAVSAAAATDAAVAHCDANARATAASWYVCIEELREAGHIEFADSELAALVLAFPDFEVPVADK